MEAAPLARICSHCEYAALSQGGVFCMFFREEILRETVAEECEEYDAIDLAPVIVRHPASVSVGSVAPVIELHLVPPKPFHSNGKLLPEDLELREACVAYLAGLHVSAWGKSWSVATEEDRRAAAVWLVRTIEQILTIKEVAEDA